MAKENKENSEYPLLYIRSSVVYCSVMGIIYRGGAYKDVADKWAAYFVSHESAYKQTASLWTQNGVLVC